MAGAPGTGGLPGIVVGFSGLTDAVAPWVALSPPGKKVAGSMPEPVAFPYIDMGPIFWLLITVRTHTSEG